MYKNVYRYIGKAELVKSMYNGKILLNQISKISGKSISLYFLLKSRSLIVKKYSFVF